MEIKLYKNNSDPSVLNKSLSNELTLTGTFRGEVNIITPTITLERSDTSICEINKFNYLYIPDLKRYYFVQNITVSPQGIMSVSLAEDVIQSYKTSILQLSAFVERAQSSYDAEIPDTLATAKPKITITASDFTASGLNAHVFRTLEEVWGDNPSENSKLSYLIKFSHATFHPNRGASTAQGVSLKSGTPTPTIICTRGYLNRFINEVNSLGASILEHWTALSDAILTIETIPEVISKNDSDFHVIPGSTALKYKYCGDGSAAQPIDSEIVGAIKINGQILEFPSDATDQPQDILYGFPLHSSDIIQTSTFYFSPSISSNWQNSGNYSTYSVKFNPFGEFSIPSDHMVGEQTIYIEVKHSLVTGQAQASYYTAHNSARILVAETNLNFEQPFIKRGDIGGFFMSAIKGAATVALSAVAARASVTESTTTVPVTHQIEFTPNPQFQYDVSQMDTGRMSLHAGLKGGAQGPIASTRQEMFGGNMRQSFSYTDPGATTNTTVTSAEHTAKQLGISNTLNAINSISQSIPHPEMRGTLKAVLIDKVPKFIKQTRTYIQPEISHTGRPLLQNKTLSTLTGYVKCATFKFDNFRKSNDPDPMITELNMISDNLINGIVIRST